MRSMLFVNPWVSRQPSMELVWGGISDEELMKVAEATCAENETIHHEPIPVEPIAIDEDSQTDRMLGVARIIGYPDRKTGEFAVLVGDAWQGMGIESNLLEKCLSIAEKQGFKTVHALVLYDNKNMLALGKKMGFDIKSGPDSGCNKLVIHFRGSGHDAN
jgi:RimJ/RimL family protein N-acetyltransferase